MTAPTRGSPESGDRAHESPEERDTTAEAPSKCARCGMIVPVDDDGFCIACLKALEQACL